MFHICYKRNCHPAFRSFFSNVLSFLSVFRSHISKLPSSSFFPRHLNQTKVEGSGKNTTWETLRVQRPQISQMHTKPQVVFMNCCKHGLRVRNTSNQGFIQVVLRFEVNVALIWQHPEECSVSKFSGIYLLLSAPVCSLTGK